MNKNINIHISPTYIHVINKYIQTYIYTYIRNIYANKTERVFNDDIIYLSHIKNESFHDMVIPLVQQRKVLQSRLFLLLE